MADWVGSAPLLVVPRRQAQKAPPGQTNGSGGPAGPRPARPPGAGVGEEPEEEPYSDDPVRNRQKELQDAIVAAEDAETILATVRELDGAIVISTAMHRLGKVAGAGGSSGAAEVVRDPRFAILMDKFKLRLPFFGSRQISNSLHGLGNLLYREQGSWVQMVSIQTQRRIRDFEPQHVSNTLWACARMQLKEPLMLQALLGRAIEDIPRSCPLDVSIVTWACATMKLKEVEWLRAVVRARLEFADFSPQNMSNFVWGLATLGFRNDNMVLAVGREAARKVQDFIPQELSNFTWALATLDLCDNLMLRAVAEEVDRRGADVINTWDPQSLSNMMWAYATLAVKDDPLFRRLLDASIARIADHDPQNLANSSWAAAMVSFRCSRFLNAVAQAAVRQIHDCQTLHLAQLAFAFTRCCFDGARHGFLKAMKEESMQRVEEFAAQSLFDVYDALLNFGAITTAPNPILRSLDCHFEGLMRRLEAFARQCAQGLPGASQVLEYRRSIEQLDIVTLGSHHTLAFLRRFGLLCQEGDPFVRDAQRQIREWRDAEAAKDPVSRSIFHRAQCAWQLGAGGGAQGGPLADGIFESGVPTGGGPERHGLVVCRLRHPREGDAEIQALCAALSTSVFRSGRPVQGLSLHLHLSDLPCVSCLGATLQFSFRFPGVLRVSFDRGRQLREDSVVIPRPPPPPSRKGNALPYAPTPDLYAKKGASESNGATEGGVERCMLRRDGPDCRETTSFYLSNTRAPRRSDGAASGGAEAVPHKRFQNLKGGSQQTYYFSARPDFYASQDYDGCE